MSLFAQASLKNISLWPKKSFFSSHLEKKHFHDGFVKDSSSQQESTEREKEEEDGFQWNLCWLLARWERVKIRLSGENTGDACVLSLGTADGLTLLRLQRTQHWVCICAPKQWDWTPQPRRSLSRRYRDRRTAEAKGRLRNTDSSCFFWYYATLMALSVLEVHKQTQL